MANQVLDNKRALQLRSVAVLRRVPRVFPRNKTKILLLIAAGLVTAILWVAISSAGRIYRTPTIITDRQAKLDTDKASDAVAPAARTDSSLAVPPSVQALHSVSIESINGKTSATVNGKTAPLSPNGSMSQTYVSPDGEQSSISITTNTSTSANNSSSSSTSTSISSNSFSSSTNTDNFQLDSKILEGDSQ